MTMRTPSQTIGPFFHVGLKWEAGAIVAFPVAGQRLVLTGRLFDGAGAAITDALIETWQAGPDGNVPAAVPAAKAAGYSRTATDADGRYTIETLMPGSCTGRKGEKFPPQIHVTVFARGLLKALRTRVFLADPETAKHDPLAVAAGSRAGTLVAVRDTKDPAVWHWDVRLQGKDETAFIEA